MKKGDPLVQALAALKQLMDLSGCPWMIIGGVAASLLGKPRFTADVDTVVLIEIEDLPKIMKNAVKAGLKPRLKDVIPFARKNRVLLLKHAKSGINLDISLGLLPFEREAIQKSRPHKIAGLNLNLPAAEDLIIFKAVAHRPQDMLDIQEIVTAHPKINVKYIKKALREFSSALEMPEIWKDTEKILLNKR